MAKVLSRILLRDYSWNLCLSCLSYILHWQLRLAGVFLQSVPGIELSWLVTKLFPLWAQRLTCQLVLLGSLAALGAWLSSKHHVFVCLNVYVVPGILMASYILTHSNYGSFVLLIVGSWHNLFLM